MTLCHWHSRQFSIINGGNKYRNDGFFSHIRVWLLVLGTLHVRRMTSVSSRCMNSRWLLFHWHECHHNWQGFSSRKIKFFVFTQDKSLNNKRNAFNTFRNQPKQCLRSKNQHFTCIMNTLSQYVVFLQQQLLNESICLQHTVSVSVSVLAHSVVLLCVLNAYC